MTTATPNPPPADVAAAAHPPESAAPLLQVRSVAKRFGPREVLKNISLDMAAGEFLTLLGESGSGKTTLLRLIAGFEQPSSGEIWMDGQRLDSLPAHKRRVNTVFQHYALFPHLSVQENVAYGLRVKKTGSEEIAQRVREALQMVKMSDFAQSQPAKLSGGQQQRIALARALVNRPKLLLLDEPLSALDANLRKEMQSELKSLQRELGISFLFVTHDQEEAMALSDRIALLRNGAMEQIASPRVIYSQPATAYTAQFIGQTNLLHAEVRDGYATAGSLRWPTDAAPGSRSFSLRPEAISLASSLPTTSDAPLATGSSPASVPASATAIAQFRGVIRQQIYGGANQTLEVDCGGQFLRVRVPGFETLSGEHQFQFSASSAVLLQS